MQESARCFQLTVQKLALPTNTKPLEFFILGVLLWRNTH